MKRRFWQHAAPEPDPIDAPIGFVPPGGHDVWHQPETPPPPSAGTSVAERTRIRAELAEEWDAQEGVPWHPPHTTDPLAPLGYPPPSQPLDTPATRRRLQNFPDTGARP